MGNKNRIKDINLTIQKGGFITFEKTGIYPEFLIFNSLQLHRTWRLKLKEEKQNGVLKVNGQIAFKYYFDGMGCKMLSLTNGVVIDEWKIGEILMEIRD
jgi:hypothetical protein